MRRFALLASLLVLAATSFAAESADAIMAKAKQQAAKENKNILVKFSASWCVWCHRMDDWMHDTEAGKLVAKQYVVVVLIVDEDDKHKADENPGADDLRHRMGGDQVGIPFFGMLDKTGKVLATSNPNKDKPGNIGFPVEDNEIEHFLKMVADTSKLTKAQIEQVRASLKESAKKINGGGL